MYLLESMRDLKIYKNKKFIYTLYDEKKMNGNIIFLDSKNKKESIELINNSLISNKYTRGYFIPKTNTAHIRSVKKKKIVNQTLYYNDIKNSCKGINKVFKTLSQYKNASLYFDLSVYNELFFNNATFGNKILFNAYTEFLKDILEENEEVKTYKGKYVLLRIDDTYKDFDSFKNSMKNFLSIIYNNIYLVPLDASKYPNFTVIVVGNNSKRFFKFKPSQLNKKSLNILKRLITIIIKLENGIELSKEETSDDIATDNEEVKKENTKTNSEVAKTILKDKVNASTNGIISKKEEVIIDKIDAKIDANSDSSTMQELEDRLDNDKEFLGYLDELKNEKVTSANSQKNTSRNNLLKEKQKEIRINNDENGKTIEQIVNDMNEKVIIKDTFHINNKNNDILNQSTMKDFEKSYNKNLLEKDMIKILESFSDDNREIKVYLRKINKQDTSTPFTRKNTWTFEFEDERRVRHTVKVDIPIFIEDKFLYIEGNKKTINKQLALLPIVKVDTNKVQVVSNYGKTFISRFGDKISPKSIRFKKALSSLNNTNKIGIKLGNSFESNFKYITNVEYDDISQNIVYISSGDYEFYFSQEIIRELLDEKKIKYSLGDKNINPIGLINGKDIISYDMSNNIIYINEKKIQEINLLDYIVNCIANDYPKIKEEYDNVKIGKSFTYSRASILSRDIPLSIFLGYNEGISSLLNKSKIKYELSDRRKRLTSDEQEKFGMIPFKDVYLYYDLYPLKNSLLLNGFLSMNTISYNFEDFNTKDPYLDYFFAKYSSRAIAKGFGNFYESFVDAITKEVLEDLDYPTDITGLFLFANELLEDNQFVPETNMSNYRLRNNEVINVYLNNELEKAYSIYKNSINGATPIKMSVPQNAIIKDLQEGLLLQDYDTLNPITEVDSISTVTYKGPSGLNLAYYKIS